MHKVKSLTFIFIFSLLLMSHLYKEFSCESVVHKVDNGLEHIFDEKQLPEMRKDDSKHKILSRLGLNHGPLPIVHITGQDTIAGKSEHVEDDGRESKQESMSAVFQTSKEELIRHAPSERKRRHSSGQQSAGSQCQRHNMNVNFTAIGWSTWILAPPGYNAYYCAGECPLLLADINSTKHAQIQSTMSGLNPNIPKPCCAPTQLSSLQVAYSANSTITVGYWKEMIVEACGCL